jgi:hypothetical protein
MELNPEIFMKLLALDWFSRCGIESSDDLPFPVKRLSSVADAIASGQSDLWIDAKTEAQGDLTAYLAKNHSESYGGHWNRLMKASHARIEKEVMPKVNESLTRISAEALSAPILLDLSRIAVCSAYSKRFRRVPDFFQRLLVVYERGHLPCGWSGSLDSWPEGKLVIY